MADIVPAVAQQQPFSTPAALNMDKNEDNSYTLPGHDEDDTTSSSNGTEVFDRIHPDAADWRRNVIDGSFSPICAAMSGNSTGLSSMSSSVAAEDLNIAKTKVFPLCRKRSSDGSFKPLSTDPMISASPKLISSEQKTTAESTTAISQPAPKKRGRPPKIKQPGADLTTPTANSPKSARSSTGTNQKPQVRPRSSIPSQLPADVLASQCIEAAHGSRLNPYGLHPGEQKRIGHALSPKEVTIYLNIRNRILRLWKQNSLCSVTADEAAGCAKETRFFGLASVAHRWLVRNGYINFGCVEVPKEPAKLPGKDAKQRTVVVIGAGVSGLTTARQLEGVIAQEAGKWNARGERPPRVVVLEGRERIGGRVYSKPLRSQVTGSLPDGLRNTAEMGAMIVTGFEHGNPLDTIIRAQLGVRYHLMRDSLTIYDTNGQPVNEHADMLNTELYTDISDRAGEFRAISQKKITALGDEDLINRGRDPAPDGFAATQLEPLTAGQIRSHQPAARRGRRRNAPPGTEKLTGRSEVIEGEGVRFSAARAAKSMGWQIRDGVAKNQSVSLHQVASASAHPTLGSVMDEAIVQYQGLINLTPTDMRLLNWHHANLEYANAAPVTSLSLSGHDQDTGNEFEGAHSEIIGGYTQVPCGLMNLPTKLDVRFGHVVESIHYDDRHPSNEPVMTKVVCTNGQTFDADEVVMTVPLGVLKGDAVDFDPPLPSWKQDAIDRMGFGLLNKVSFMALLLGGLFDSCNCTGHPAIRRILLGRKSRHVWTFERARKVRKPRPQGLREQARPLLSHLECKQDQRTPNAHRSHGRPRSV
jgi:lysine-specific histone demethylase 1